MILGQPRLCTIPMLLDAFHNPNHQPVTRHGCCVLRVAFHSQSLAHWWLSSPKQGLVGFF